MVGIKDFDMPSCCMNCEMFDGEYGNCDIIGDTQDFEYQWDENRPFDCPLVEAIPKADYKTDLIAMLTELQLDIEEHTITSGVTNQGTWNECIACCSSLIQQKINSLKEA